ncbi:MAG: contractile injection system protein, VgrG/Pvc8 family [Gammaproteobacteria bacterium]|jgi:uncharacterized protein
MDAVSVNNARPILLHQDRVQEDMMAAVHQLQVTLPASGRGNAEIILVNWGDRGEGPDFQWQQMALGDAFSIAFYDEEQVVFSGEITAIEERYGLGTPQLVLLVEDSMHRLAKSRRSRAFEEMSPDDVISEIANTHGIRADVQISSGSGDWYQINETDYNFLQRIVVRWDLAARIVDGDTLRIRPEEATPDPMRVSPQANALEVRIIADLNHRFQSTGIRGWNFSSGEQIEDQADALQPAPGGTVATDLLDDLGWSEEEWLGAPHPRTPDEAREWSAAAFRRQARHFVHGEILMQGSPELKTGSEIELEEVSDRISGRYRVVNLCHRFDSASGFVSHLRVERPDWNQN